MQSFDRLRMKVLVDEDRLEDQDAIALSGGLRRITRGNGDAAGAGVSRWIGGAYAKAEPAGLFDGLFRRRTCVGGGRYIQ